MANLTPTEDRHVFSRHGSTLASVHHCKVARSGMHGRYHAGFSMIELMIVVAIIAILAAIAYPSYTHYVIKTNRAAAAGCLSEYANYMERFYTSNLRYDQDTSGTSITLPTLDCSSQTSSNYSYALNPAPTATAYTLQAVPVSGSGQANDSQCATLQLDQKGNRTDSGTDTNANDCW